MTLELYLREMPSGEQFTCRDLNDAGVTDYSAWGLNTMARRANSLIRKIKSAGGRGNPAIFERR